MATYEVTVRRTLQHTTTITVSATESSIDSKCDAIMEALDKNGSDKYGSQILEWELDSEEFEIDSADEE
jgi:hypothetical protein